MTKTPEEIKAEARKLRNKQPAKTNVGFSPANDFKTKGNKGSGGSQTVIKPPRKPSV